jgi:hypothetical protein
MRDETPHDPMLSSDWIRRTGWVQMFSGMDRRLLLKLAQPPVVQGMSISGTGEKEIVSSAADERLIQMVGLAVDRFFDRCEDTVLHTDH